MPYSFNTYTVFYLGEQGSGFQPLDNGIQDFYLIRESCLGRGQLFEDPEFPANDKSLFLTENSQTNLKWKRPMEIVKDPKLIVEDISRTDIQQGKLGDCWFLAALTCMTLKKSLLDPVIPKDQGFIDKYAGVFHFRFWQYGQWIDVVIDDRLPTLKNKPVYLRSSSANEFWSPLLEKAYAKLRGSYKGLRQGHASEALKDFTGGITEVYNFTEKNKPENFYQIVLKAFERSSLMCCAIKAKVEEFNEPTPEGLIRGHAYSITGVRYVNMKTSTISSQVPLIRVRNPWGNEVEFRGSWSDSSKEWTLISDEEKRAMGLVNKGDGEFWMSFGDFIKVFTVLEMCHLNPVYYPDIGSEKRWEVRTFLGQWVKGLNAGGRRRDPDSFATNPQYIITLTEADEGNEEDKDIKCTVIVGLIQRKKRKNAIAIKNLSISFYIYKLEDPDLSSQLNEHFFRYNPPAVKAEPYTNMRDVSQRLQLPPGKYCIIPSTFEKNEEGKFMLRIFSEKNVDIKETEGEVSTRSSVDSGNPVIINDRIEMKIRELFQKHSDKANEVDWMGLKTILNSVIKILIEQPGNNGQFTRRNSLFGVRRDNLFGAGRNSISGKKQNSLSDDVCRSMVAMVDEDKTGYINWHELQLIWADIYFWTTVFREFSNTTSGELTPSELRQALDSIGYKVNSAIVNILICRYSDKQKNFTLDNFLACAVKLKTMSECYKENLENHANNKTPFTLAEWLERTLYC